MPGTPVFLQFFTSCTLVFYELHASFFYELHARFLRVTRRTAHQFFYDLSEAYEDLLLSYRTIENWVKAFNNGDQSVSEMARTDCPSVNEERMQTMSALLEVDLKQTICHLAI